MNMFKQTKAIIRFPLEEELPIDLIKKLVKADVKKNEAGKK